MKNSPLLLLIGCLLVSACNRSAKSVNGDETCISEVKLGDFKGTWKCTSIIREDNDDSDFHAAAKIETIDSDSPTVELLVNDDNSFSLRSTYRESMTLYKGRLEKISCHTIVAHKILGPVIDVKNPKDASDTWEIKIFNNHVYLKISSNATYVFSQKR